MTRIVPDANVAAPHLSARTGKAGVDLSLAFQQALAAALGEDTGGQALTPGETPAETAPEAEPRAPEGKPARVDLASLLAAKGATRPEPAAEDTGESAAERLAKASARIASRAEAARAGQAPSGAPATDPGRGDPHRGGPHSGEAERPTRDQPGGERAATVRNDAAAIGAAFARQPTAAARGSAGAMRDDAPHRPAAARTVHQPLHEDAPADPRRALLRGDGRTTPSGLRGDAAGDGTAARNHPVTTGETPRMAGRAGQRGEAGSARAAPAEAPRAAARLDLAAKDETADRPRLETARQGVRAERAEPLFSRTGARAEIVANTAPIAVESLDQQQQHRRRAPLLRAAESSPVHDSLNATVTRRETHFAPVMMPQRDRGLGAAPRTTGIDTPPPVSDASAPSSESRAATEQLGRLIERTLPELRGAEMRAPTPTQLMDAAARPQAQQAQGPVRVVELHLQPATLGSLTVTMRLSAGGLKVNVVTSVRETAARLGDDRAELTQLIRRAGYEATEITVEPASAPQGGGSGEDNAPSGGERRDPEERRATRRPVDETRTRRTIHV